MKNIIKKMILTLMALIVLIISSIIIYITPKSCEINNDFNMKYDIDKEYITFHINRKDTKSFKVYQYTNYDDDSYNITSIGYIFADRSKFLERSEYKLVGPGFGVPHEDSIFGDIITYKRFSQLSHFVYDERMFFSNAATLHTNGAIKLPLEKSSNYNVFSKKIKIEELISNGSDFVPLEKRHGEQEIIVRINLIHEPMLKECSKFETNPIKILFDLKD